MARLRPDPRTAARMLVPLFLLSGGGKLAGMDVQERMFRRWGHSRWFLTAVGVAEVGGALLLVDRRTRGLAALGLTGLTAGAVGTHLRHGEGLAALHAAAVLGLCAGVAWDRRRDLAGALSRAAEAVPFLRAGA